ncbi:MAG: SDR family NAD(P)-dependent oxidoreductase, partial [Steroidobacteraceae bacterium]
MQGRTALITGGARRIGRETALALAQQGASVVIHFHHSEREAQALAGELERLGVGAWTLRADLCDPGDRGTLIERARALAGGLDILVNNASIFPAEPFNELTWRQLSLDMEVNAWAPLAFSRDFARGIARGSIINLQDTHLEGYDLEHAGYILSKHVLAALTRMMALALAPAVTVNAVAPGFIDTDMTRATARRMGITTPLPDTPSLPIGADAVNVLEHTTAYATFPNEG